MAIVAYLRDGGVYADQEAYERGLRHADYRIVYDDPPFISARIKGREYVSLWCWPDDAKRHFGAVILIEANTKGDFP